MRRTQIIALVLILILLVCGFFYAYPTVAPIIANPPHDHILTVILNDLLFQDHPNQGVWQYFPALLIVIGVILYAVIGYDLKHRPRRTHGSAGFARGKGLRNYRAPRRLASPQILPQLRMPGWPGQLVRLFGGSRHQEARLYLGKYRGRVISLSESQQYEHLLLTAPTGAGKSTKFFIPNLLQETGARSLFIADLKNELYRITAGWLSQSMQIWLFAPMQPKISQGYNPLAHIKSVEDAQDFAEIWVANTGTNDKDAYWEKSARLLISATVLHLLATEKAPAFSRLADIITTHSFEEIRDIFNKTRSQDARYLARQFVENMQKNERLIGSIMTEIGNRFQFLASPNARAVTAINDIDFHEMIETPTAFFLSIPLSEARRYRPLLAVLAQQMFKEWERRGTNGIACYLDEFTNLGYLPGYADFIATARALKVGLFMAIQNFSQLLERYGKNNADTIKANAITHLLLPGGGLEETRYYSERIGDTTVATWTVNRRGSGMAQETSYTEGETRRRLMTADELRTMPEDQMLMLRASSSPLLLKTTPYFGDEKLMKRANIPYSVTKVRSEPSVPPPPQGIPAAASTGNKKKQEAPTIVDADVEKDDDILFADE